VFGFLRGVCGFTEREVNKAGVGQLAKQGSVNLGVKTDKAAVKAKEAGAMLEHTTGDQDEMLSASVGIPAFFSCVGDWLTQWGIVSGRLRPDAQGHQSEDAAPCYPNQADGR
jgi:hypothetical protein